MPPILAVLIIVVVCMEISRHLNALLQWGALIFLAVVVYQAINRPRTGRRRRPLIRPPAWQPRTQPQTIADGRVDASGHQDARALKAGAEGEARVRNMLAGLGFPTLHDVILADGRGLTQVDHLVLLPRGIAVLETKNYGGFVAGASDRSLWKQSFGYGPAKVWFHFQNPMHQNHRHVCAVREITGLENHVLPLVVMGGTARTSDWVASQTVTPAGIGRALIEQSAPLAPIAPAAVGLAWQFLKDNAEANAGRRQEHLDSLTARF